MKTAIAVLAALLATRTVAADPKAEAEATLRAWEKAFNAHDVKTMVSYYADDVRFIYGVEGQEGKGKAGVQKTFEGLFAQQKDAKVAVKSLEVKIIDATHAVVLGLWDDTIVGPDGKEMVLQVQTSDVLVKGKGGYKLLIDHASFVPPPQPPPAKS